ncbi:MAG TPA: uracil-DNA glycosylase [Saprospiraceae bacterium]|nr:uracil-DNA glycosylase [Saprospiraceae bacterium]
MEIIVDKVNMDPTWKNELIQEFKKPYFSTIKSLLTHEKKNGKILYPPGSQIFNAFNLTPFDRVKVVILGQDPYHGPGEAMGLSFSVPTGIRIPPSLINIFKEIHSDCGFQIPKHGDLTYWATQGVLLLNAMLTVEHKKPGSHQHIGWQRFTDTVISKLSQKRTGLVFLLWGNFAKNKGIMIDRKKHLVLEAAHPSPLARGAFFGCRHFSKTNEYLTQQGLEAIDWQIPDNLK